MRRVPLTFALAVVGVLAIVRLAADPSAAGVRATALVQQGEPLSPDDASGVSDFGFSVALSANGETAVVGGPGDDDQVGAAWVFTRSGSTWSQQGAKLTATGESGKGQFGAGVAISADGSTVLIGAPEDADEKGAAWVFRRSGSSWTQQGPKFTPAAAGVMYFGGRVALAGDGASALISSRIDDSDNGAAWVFTRRAAGWREQGGMLHGRGQSGIGSYLPAVALSASGSTALIGDLTSSGNGAAWLLTRAHGKWTQTSVIDAPGASDASFGESVALSAGAGAALVGAPGFASAGAAWVFTRSRAGWTRHGVRLSPSGELGEGSFGSRLALSADGSSALVSAPGDDGGHGAAWSFRRSGSKWAQQGAKLTPSATGLISDFGTSAALSGDAGTALLGGHNGGLFNGAAWPFATTP